MEFTYDQPNIDNLKLSCASLIEGYNNTPHRGLGNKQTPNDIHHLKKPEKYSKSV